MKTERKTGRIGGIASDIGLVVVACLVGLVLMRPGVFSVDESHYTLAADALLKTGTFRVSNGYERLRHPSLLYFYTVVPDRIESLGTVATVPPFHAVLALPFLAAFGMSGLVVLNILAFAVTSIAIRRLALICGLENRWAVATSVAFAAGGFSLEYALGIWPHALSQALVAWTFLLFVKATGKHDGGLGGLFTAGLLGGVATGVRLQNIVWLPALLAILLPGAARKGASLTAWLAGWFLPLLGMSLVNQWRLGTPNPFTYGRGGELASIPLLRGLAESWDVVSAMAVVLVLAAVLIRKKRQKLGGWTLPCAAGAFLLVVVSIPSTRGMLLEYIGRLLFFVVDPAFGPKSMQSAGGHAGPWGQVFYGGVLKKGLLETIPLAAAALAAPALYRDTAGERKTRKLWLAAMSAIVALPVILSAGGWCYNPRYLLEIVPALFVLAAFGFRRISPERPAVLAGVLAGLLASLPVLLRPGSVERPGAGRYQLLVGVALSVGPFLALILFRHFQKGKVFLQKLAAGVLSASFCYGTCVQLGSDLRASLTVRHYSARMCDAARKAIGKKALLLAWEARKDTFTPLKLDHDLWLGGLRWRDEEKGFPFEKVEPDREVFVLANGIPRDRLDILLENRRYEVKKVHDLVFLRLLK